MDTQDQETQDASMDVTETTTESIQHSLKKPRLDIPAISVDRSFSNFLIFISKLPNFFIRALCLLALYERITVLKSGLNQY